MMAIQTETHSGGIDVQDVASAGDELELHEEIEAFKMSSKGILEALENIEQVN